MMTELTERQMIAQQLENEIGPLLEMDRAHEDGYNCCGCSTYRQILDHAKAIVKGEVYP